MKTLKAFGIATLIAATASTAAFASSQNEDAAKQTPFVYSEAANAAPTVVRVNRGSEDAARQPPFVYEEAGNTASRADTSVISSRFLDLSDDAARQTPFVYAD